MILQLSILKISFERPAKKGANMTINRKKFSSKISLFLVLTLLFWTVGAGMIYADDDISDHNDQGPGAQGFFGPFMEMFRSLWESLKSIFIESDALDDPQDSQEIVQDEEMQKPVPRNKKERSENNDMDQAEKETEQKYNFGEEISRLAQGLETRETSVDELVEAATSIHLQVLDDVSQKVPAQAKAAIANAKEKSQRGIENAKKALSDEDEDGKETEYENDNGNGPSAKGKHARENNPSKNMGRK